MHMHYDEGFRAKFYYSDRKESLVKIENSLILPNIPDILLKIWMPRRWFAEYSAVDSPAVQWCIETILQLATQEVSSRKREISLPICCIPRGRIILSRKDLALVKQFLHSPPPEPPGSHSLYLRQILLMSFFSGIHRHFKTVRRGRYGKVYQEYTGGLMGILWICKYLVLKAKDDWHLGRRIREITEEPEIAAYLKKYQDLYDDPAEIPETFIQQLLIVALAHRASKWKWKEAEHPNILDMHPQDVFAQYLYGKKRKELDRFKDLPKRDPWLWDRIMEIFEKQILGPSDVATKNLP